MFHTEDAGTHIDEAGICPPEGYLVFGSWLKLLYWLIQAMQVSKAGFSYMSQREKFSKMQTQRFTNFSELHNLS